MLMPATGDIGAPAHIAHLAHGPAVNSHPHPNLRLGLERLRNLERALRWLLRTVPKDQRHPITRRQPNELFVRRLATCAVASTISVSWRSRSFCCFDQELRITDHVDE